MILFSKSLLLDKTIIKKLNFGCVCLIVCDFKV